LEILAFPCNQFGGQEPGTNEEIKAFAQGKCSKCFPLFDKIDVNGDAESPLWTFLKAEQGNGVLPSDIVWNFTKFLVNRKGEVVKRFNPQESPSSFENDIVDLL
jgi:glutathione peroxidase